MRRVEVDCNFNWLGVDKPALSHREAQDFGLFHGQRVIAYQHDDEWDADVMFDLSLPHHYQWYIVLQGRR